MTAPQITLTPALRVEIHDEAERATEGDCLIVRFLQWQSRVMVFPIRSSGGTSCRWYYAATFDAADAPAVKTALRELQASTGDQR